MTGNLRVLWVTALIPSCSLFAKGKCATDSDCPAGQLCSAAACMASIAPEVAIVTQSASTIVPGEAATLVWSTNTSGEFLIVASTAADARSVIARGRVDANAQTTSNILGDDLLIGLNSVDVIVLAS